VPHSPCVTESRSVYLSGRSLLLNATTHISTQQQTLKAYKKAIHAHYYIRRDVNSDVNLDMHPTAPNYQLARVQHTTNCAHAVLPSVDIQPQ
jgi:hypothetical protein